MAGLEGLKDRARRLLVVMPHPDDEAYGCAGALFGLSKDPDAATALMTLTDGEASTVLGKDRTREEVAALRRDRLAQVQSLVGLDALLLPGLPDGRLSRLKLSELAAPIIEALRAFGPQVVVVQDARGVNAHPDHIACHWAVRYAIEQVPVPRLAMLGYLQEACDAAKPRLLLPTREDEIDVVLHLDEDATRAKEAALRVHDGLVTLMDDGPQGCFRRPPIERYDLLGEDFAPPLDDLFAQLG